MSASLSPAPFRFELDLGAAPVERRTLTVPELDAMLYAAREEGRVEGYRAGEDSAVARAADALAADARRLAQEAEAMLASIDSAREALKADAVTLSDRLARKLAHRLMEAHPVGEIAGLVEEALGNLTNAPHLVIRAAPQLADDIRDVASAAIAASGYAGRLIVMGDPEIAAGDARIEWAEGGLVRDLKKLEAELDTRISEFLAARPPVNEET